MIVNYLLVILATFCLYYPIRFYLMNRKKNSLGRFVLSLGLFATIWLLGYALMGITTDIGMAPYYRQFALIGASGFMCVEALFFAYKAGLSANTQKIMQVISLFLMAGDVFIWGAHDVRSFYRDGNRTLYVNGKSNGLYYQPLFMLLMTVVLVALYVRWRKHTVFVRDKRFQKLFFMSNIYILLGAVPDTILPILGMESFPSSPIGGFFTMIVMVNLCSSYMYYEIDRESLNRLAYSHDDVGYMAFTSAGRLIIANPYARKAMGITGTDNSRISDLFDTSGRYDADIMADILGGRHLQWSMADKSGRKSYSLRFSVARDDEGEPYCIICALYDRTNEQELMDRISESSAAKSSFLANMSHEIRTPINAILGMNEMIQRESADEKISEYANDMGTAGTHLLNIVNDILDYSKIQSGKMDLVCGDYDLSLILCKTAVSCRQGADRKKLGFDMEVDPELPIFLNGDEVRIAQIINNITENALKYTDKGRIGINITKNDVSEGSIELIITVSDTGKGIGDCDREKLFNAFVRADHEKNQTIAGTGLGLAISGSLAEMMGGEIGMESSIGAGSVFTVRIPQTVVSYHKIGDFRKVLETFEASRSNGLFREYTAPSARILVVDDNPVNLNVAKYILRKTKIKVDTATGGEEAVSLIRDNSYQMVFLDHIMPGIDGVETLQRIRDEKLAENVPIICLSANDMSSSREMYMDYGFSDYLAKPVSGGRLEAKVYEWLPADFIHEKKDQEVTAGKQESVFPVSFTKGSADVLWEAFTEDVKNTEKGKNDITHIFIINPVVATEGQINRIREQLECMDGIRYFMFTSNGEGDETELVHKVQKYFPNGRIRLYSIGGSGTLRNMINGIEDFERVEVAFYPLGLTNDFIKVFGDAAQRFKDIRALVNGNAVSIDYIKTTAGISLNTFSVGLDSNLVRALKSNRIFKAFGSMVPYVMAFTKAMLISNPEEYEIIIDDEHFEGPFGQLIFGNGCTLGGSFKFDDAPVINDGMAQVMLAGNYVGLSDLPVVMALVKGDMEKLSRLANLKKARRLSIRKRDGGQLAINFDGEMVDGVENWEAEIIERGLKFIVPEGVKVNGQ